MNSDNAMNCKNFEIKIWLFLEKSLPDNEMELWKKHISECEACRNLLEETKEILSSAEQDICHLDDIKFKCMIERATADSGFSSGRWFNRFFIRPFRFPVMYRAALAGAAAAAVILISPLLRESNTDRIVSNDLLDWNGTEINRELNRLQEKLSSFNEDSWSREIDYIDSRIDTINERISQDVF